MKIKKLIYISKYLELPSYSAYGSRGYHLIKNIKDFDVEIITSDSNNLVDEEEPFNDKIVTVLKAGKLKKAKSFYRILSWIIFELKLFFLLIRRPKADILICSSLSLLSIVNGIIYKKITGAKLIFEIRDIWPLTLIEEGGFSKSNLFIKFLRFIEKKGYTSSDLIIGTMPNLEEHVKNSVSCYPKVLTIPMGYSHEQIHSAKKANLQFNLDNQKTNICYAGTLGISNNISQLLEFADFCLHHRPNFNFFFLGDGSNLREIKDCGISNVNYLGKVQRHEINSALSKFDCLIFSTHKSTVWSFGQSLNKLIDYMLANKPILGFYDGFESMINETSSGTFIKHDDFYGAINFIDKCKALNITSREWIIKKRNYISLSDMLEKELKLLNE